MADETASERRRRRATASGNQETATPKTAPKSEPKDSTVPKKKERTPNDRKLAKSIAESYQMVGMMGMGFALRIQDAGLMGSSQATVEQSEVLAEAWLDLADKSPKVKAALKRFTEVSAAGTLVALHISIMIPFLADRGMVPAPLAVAFTNGNGN